MPANTPPDEVEKILAALLRLSQVMSARSNLAAGAVGISQLQLEILTLLAAHGGTETIGYFARRFMISAATVSDSIRVLEAKGLISRTRDKADARSFQIGISESGRECVAVSKGWTQKLQQIVAGWEETRRVEFLPALIELIDGCQREGVATVDRICVACRFLAINCDSDAPDAPHYCRLYQSALRPRDLRVDCPDFEPVI